MTIEVKGDKRLRGAFANMKVGEKRKVPMSMVEPYNCAYKYGRSHGQKFSLKTIDNALYVTRIE